MHQLNTENLAKVLELLCVLYISGGDQGAIRRRSGGNQEAIRRQSGGGARNYIYLKVLIYSIYT